MILVVMCAEAIRFKRLREEYASCPDYGELYISHYEMGSLEGWTIFCYMKDIYLDFISYVFFVGLSVILALESCMLEVWLNTSARTR